MTAWVHCFMVRSHSPFNICTRYYRFSDTWLLHWHIGKIAEAEQKSLTNYRLRAELLAQLIELFRGHFYRPQHGPHLCGTYCDATYLGLILTLNKENDLPIHRNDWDADIIHGPLEVFKTLTEWKETLSRTYCGERSRATGPRQLYSRQEVHELCQSSPRIGKSRDSLHVENGRLPEVHLPVEAQRARDVKVSSVSSPGCSRSCQ